MRLKSAITKEKTTMHFACFYQKSAIAPFEPVEACGDRAVIVLDGRSRPQTHVEIARKVCLKRGYIGFTLHMGETFMRASNVRELELI